MEQVFTKKDIIADLSERTGYYKKELKIVIDELSDLISDYISSTTADAPVKIALANGIVIGGKFVPAKEGTNPRTCQKIIIPEHILPYAKFSSSFKQRVND